MVTVQEGSAHIIVAQTGGSAQQRLGYHSNTAFCKRGLRNNDWRRPRVSAQQ